MDKSTAKIKRRCNKIKQFVFLCCHQAFLGISWLLRCSDVLPQQFIKFFFCSGPGFYFGSARPSASPHQNKTLAPHKKSLINCFDNTLENLTVHKIPSKA